MDSVFNPLTGLPDIVLGTDEIESVGDSRYIKLDQTTPQTIENGTPTFEEGAAVVVIQSDAPTVPSGTLWLDSSETAVDTTDHAELSNLDYANSGHTGFEPARGDDDNYVTDAEKTVLANTSGTNTGDQDLSDYAKLTDTEQDITANSFVTDGGTSSQFVKGDGSLDSSTYLTAISGCYVDRGSRTTVDFAQSALTSDDAFHDLDLSSIVPSGAKAVLLALRTVSTSSNVGLIIIGYGYAESPTIDKNRAYINGPTANQTYAGDFLVPLTSTRIVRYRQNNGATYSGDITVKGWWL